VLTGVFATRAVQDVNNGEPVGLIEGGNLLGGQIAGVVVTWILAIVVTFILLKVLDAVMGLRVTTQEEIQGLDLTQHGEEGYIYF
jgi:Amt family ammonium transporter